MGTGYKMEKTMKEVVTPKSSFLDQVKKRVYTPVVDATATAISAPSRMMTGIKTKMKQNKMISEHVNRQGEKIAKSLSTQDRSFTNIENKKIAMDKNIKAKLKSKGIY